MAAIARARLAHVAGATVVQESFERWEPTVHGVNVVASANAWQWLDPAVRWRKAADLLAADGHLALLWHDLIGYSPPNFAARFAEVGGALNPALAATSEAAASTRYPFTRSLDGEAFVATLNTYGVNDALSTVERERLARVLGALIDDEFGGVVHKHEDAVLHLARRR